MCSLQSRLTKKSNAKKTLANIEMARVKSVRRTRSRRMKFCVQRGLGGIPQQARGAIWIATGIACRSLPSLSYNITKSDFMCVLLYLLTLSSTIAHRTRACAGPCEFRQRTARTNTRRPAIREVQETPSCQGAIHSSE